jgi:hypothetical protein
MSKIVTSHHPRQLTHLNLPIRKKTSRQHASSHMRAEPTEAAKFDRISSWEALTNVALSTFLFSTFAVATFLLIRAFISFLVRLSFFDLVNSCGVL